MTTASARAWVVDGPDRFVLERISLPPLRPGWLRCRVLRFQPSITDAMRFRGLGDADEFRRGRRFIGHEFVAQVVQASESAHAALIGQRVVCGSRNPCGACAECVRDRPYLCQLPVRIGEEGPAAMAEMIDLPAAHVHTVPAELSDLAACCSQPAASSVANIVHAQLEPGARVVILGQGIMGLFLLQAARVYGAADVLTTAPRASVRALSVRLGATESLAPDAPETPGRLRDFGPDLVIDAAGGPRSVGLSGTSTLDQALQAVRRFGTVLEISDITVPMMVPQDVGRRAIRLVFGHNGHWYYGVYPRTLEFLRDGRLRCDGIVTHEVNGIERLPEALDLMARRRETEAIQVQVVVPSNE